MLLRQLEDYWKLYKFLCSYCKQVIIQTKPVTPETYLKIKLSW